MVCPSCGGNKFLTRPLRGGDLLWLVLLLRRPVECYECRERLTAPVWWKARHHRPPPPLPSELQAVFEPLQQRTPAPPAKWPPAAAAPTTAAPRDQPPTARGEAASDVMAPPVDMAENAPWEEEPVAASPAPMCRLSFERKRPGPPAD
ncbi:MAG: hypothetical protein JSU00_16455 [Acidobacteria bacterium]|nr:hypothetical protein [Acidobacteriota bacterium]